MSKTKKERKTVEKKDKVLHVMRDELRGNCKHRSGVISKLVKSRRAPPRELPLFRDQPGPSLSSLHLSKHFQLSLCRIFSLKQGRKASRVQSVWRWALRCFGVILEYRKLNITACIMQWLWELCSTRGDRFCSTTFQV